MIQFRCKCGNVLRTKSEYAGRPLKCPGCAATLRVPTQEEQTSAPATEQKKPKSRQAAKTRSSSEARTKKQKSRSSESAQRPRRKQKRKAQPVEELVDIDDFAIEDDFAPEDDFAEEDDYGYDDGGFDEGGYDDYAPAPPKARKKKSKSPVAIPESKKKKARKAREKAESEVEVGLSPKVMYALFGFAGLVGIGVLVFVGQILMSADRGSAESDAVPEEFDHWKHELGGLSTEYPKGWTLTDGGGSGGVPPWVAVENARQKIDIRIAGSRSGTPMADIAKAGSDLLDQALPQEVLDELEPVAKVHQFQFEKISLNYDKYEETDPVKIQTGFGSARMSEFVGTKVFSTEYGVRVTLLGNLYQFNMICKCPKDRLEEYKPVFERMAKSAGK